MLIFEMITILIYLIIENDHVLSIYAIDETNLNVLKKEKIATENTSCKVGRDCSKEKRSLGSIEGNWEGKGG